MERIDKVISNQMCLTRSEARRLIKIGKVTMGGTRVKAFDTKISETDEIIVDGKPLNFAEKIYIMMNKSQDVVCDDKGKFPYAPDVLPENLRRKDLFCVGRLDKDTTGLLLITNDGDFAHKVITPKKQVQKSYLATLSEPITDENISLAKSGMTLSDGTKLLSAEVEIVSDDRKTVRFKISEGKYHQIKRMAGAFDNKVVSLHRERIGALSIPQNLKIGEAVEIEYSVAQKVFESL